MHAYLRSDVMTLATSLYVLRSKPITTAAALYYYSCRVCVVSE